MTYATVAQLREYLTLQTTKTTPNATSTAVAATDEKLTAILDRATSSINEALMFGFAAYPAATKRSVACGYVQMLRLPAHEIGSITEVIDSDSVVTNTDYELLTSDDGRAVHIRRIDAAWRGPRLYVTAKWGVGPAPASIVEVCLELAVNIWRSAQRALFSDAIGVDAVGNSVGGGAVAYSQQMTRSMRATIEAVRASYRGVAV